MMFASILSTLKSFFTGIGALFKFLSESELREDGERRAVLKATLDALDAKGKANAIDLRDTPADRTLILREL